MASKTQKGILLSLVVQDGPGTNWTNEIEGWEVKGKDNICYWDGIMCSSDGVVMSIILPRRGFVGTLPGELALLSSLREIDMSENIIFGSVPFDLLKLKSLETVSLGDTAITGRVPLFASKVLRRLDLSGNHLHGYIPTDIGTKNPELRVFDLKNNFISGTIPDSLSRLGRLKTLSLSGNRLSGLVPGNLGKMEELEYLNLDNNNLMGTLSPDLFKVDSSLSVVSLKENMLSGTIPHTVYNLKKLRRFYVHGNKLTGSVPPDMCNENINREFFKGFDTTDTPNYCDSVACPANYASLQGTFPCTPCINKFCNPYIGKTGNCTDLEEPSIIDLFLESVGQNITSNVAFCTEDGVLCDASGHVITIDFKSRELEGTIPAELGFLRFLSVLDLSDNNLTGFLPAELSLAPLRKLDISGNKLKGYIPQSLCSKMGLNGNGVNGVSSCERVACSVGSYRSGTSMCSPCKHAPYIGAKECVKGNELHPVMIIALTVFGLLGFIGYALLVFNFMSTMHKAKMPTRDTKFISVEKDSPDDVLGRSGTFT